jgi:hypothetical protein
LGFWIPRPPEVVGNGFKGFEVVWNGWKNANGRNRLHTVSMPKHQEEGLKSFGDGRNSNTFASAYERKKYLEKCTAFVRW